SGETDANGVITWRVSSDATPAPAGTLVNFTANAGGSIGPVGVTFVRPLASAGKSTIEVIDPPPPDPREVIANDSSYATIVVTVRDSEGEPSEGTTVTLLESTALGTTVFVPTDPDHAQTNENGVAVFRVRSANAGIATY